VAETTGRTPEDSWQIILRLRWLLAGVALFAFALGRVLEVMLIRDDDTSERIVFDLLFWGALGGGAVWLSLTWVFRQERRYQTELAQALRQEQRANAHLSLLSDANRQFVGSATLDEILNTALDLPRRLLPTRAVALVLHDADGPVETRTTGASPAELAQLRAGTGLDLPDLQERRPRVFAPAAAENGGACVLLPLHDGVAPVGWLEIYLRPGTRPDADELALLETIGKEVAEAIVGARRRSREERALYELERAIADERARIARDIHDGLAQGLAFRRMRIDLWQEWIADDPERLRAELQDLKRALREQIQELRRAIFALRPMDFDEFGFLGGLHRYILEFAGQHGWQAEVDLSRAPATLTRELEATTFRIVQEALTNAAKHARATQIGVALSETDGGLRVVVTDNGRGFDPGERRAEAHDTDGYGHVGLRQMRERLAALRGQLTILSRPGAGTEVRAWLPLPPETAADELATAQARRRR
jgi:signal transduction histidine kinase